MSTRYRFSTFAYRIYPIFHTTFSETMFNANRVWRTITNLFPSLSIRYFLPFVKNDDDNMYSLIFNNSLIYKLQTRIRLTPILMEKWLLLNGMLWFTAITNLKTMVIVKQRYYSRVYS